MTNANSGYRSSIISEQCLIFTEAEQRHTPKVNWGWWNEIFLKGNFALVKMLHHSWMLLYINQLNAVLTLTLKKKAQLLLFPYFLFQSKRRGKKQLLHCVWCQKTPTLFSKMQVTVTPTHIIFLRSFFPLLSSVI